MIENYKNSCKTSSFQTTGSTCSDFNVIGSSKDKTGAGYESYLLVYTTQEKYPDGTNGQRMYVVGQIPDGNDTWVLVLTGSPNAAQSYSDDVKTIGDSFTISDYNGAVSTTLQPTPLLNQKQFQLHTKASQTNDIVYLVIKNPKDSSDVIKVKLKVDSKNTEIQWEAFTKDQKSLGTGKVGT